MPRYRVGQKMVAGYVIFCHLCHFLDSFGTELSKASVPKSGWGVGTTCKESRLSRETCSKIVQTGQQTGTDPKEMTLDIGLEKEAFL